MNNKKYYIQFDSTRIKTVLNTFLTMINNTNIFPEGFDSFVNNVLYKLYGFYRGTEILIPFDTNSPDDEDINLALDSLGNLFYYTFCSNLYTYLQYYLNTNGFLDPKSAIPTNYIDEFNHFYINEICPLNSSLNTINTPAYKDQSKDNRTITNPKTLIDIIKYINKTDIFNLIMSSFKVCVRDYNVVL